MFEPRTLLLAVKPATALLGAALLTWEALARHRNSSRSRRFRDLSLAVLGLVAFAGWWNLGTFHSRGRYLHPHEFFHYYLGAKYFPELSYTHLYECVAAVEIEDGQAAIVARRWIRDLTSNEVRRGARVLSDLGYCRDRFSEPRWHAFTHDVLFFRRLVTGEKWYELFVDHGYNASPAWTMTGAWLAGRDPVSLERLQRLSLLDPILILCMWAVVWWAFGWRVTCVALLWWGTNVPAGFAFIGGAFLRQDWLLLTVSGVALARRGHTLASGFALAWATLLRIFPIFLIAGLAGRVLFDLWSRRSPRPQGAHLRFGAGLLLAALLLVPLSLAAQGGMHAGIAAWQAFVANSRKHSGSQSPNRLGLVTVTAFSPETRAATIGNLRIEAPWDVWTTARNRRFEERRPLFLVIVGVFLLVLASALKSSPDWVALVLGATLIPVVLELSNYYFGFLLVLAFLWPSIRVAGIGLCAASALTGAAAAIWPMEDDRAVASSVAILGVVCAVVGMAAWRGGKSYRTDRPEPVSFV